MTDAGERQGLVVHDLPKERLEGLALPGAQPATVVVEQLHEDAAGEVLDGRWVVGDDGVDQGAVSARWIVRASSAGCEVKRTGCGHDPCMTGINHRPSALQLPLSKNRLNSRPHPFGGPPFTKSRKDVVVQPLGCHINWDA